MTPVLREEDHTYWVGAQRWLGVTEVLKLFGEYDAVPRHLLEAAADFGKKVHLAIHLHDSGTLDMRVLDPALAACVEQWQRWLKARNATVLASEVLVWHPTYRYAGMFDKIVRIPPLNHLVDVKSSVAVPEYTAEQTAAYREAYLKRPDALRLSKKRYCVRVSMKDYEQKIYTSNSDLNLFISALNVARRRSRYVH